MLYTTTNFIRFSRGFSFERNHIQESWRLLDAGRTITTMPSGCGYKASTTSAPLATRQTSARSGIAVGVARSGPEDQHGGLEDHGDVMDQRGATDETNGTDVRSS